TSYFFCTQLFFQLIQKYFSRRMLLVYLAVIIGGLIALTFRVNNITLSFELKLLAWLLLYILLLSSNYLSLHEVRFTSSRLVFWLVFFSFSITVIIIAENNQKEIENRKNYAENLSNQADPSGERLMNIMLTDFRNDFLQPNFERFKNDSVNHFLKDSLINGNFPGYINRYDTKVYTFDADEQPLHNQDSVGFNMLNTILNTQAKPTTIADLYYYDVSFDKFNYIAKKNITDTNGKTMGYVFILANPKKYKAEALYPELFSGHNNNSIENSSVYSFAVYNNLQLINSHNDYAFPAKLTPVQVPKEDFIQIKKNGYDELWYRASAENVVIIAKSDNFSIEAITLFSYLFCSFLLLTGLFWLLNFFVRKGFMKDKINSLRQISIRNQVHGTIIFISILSFIVIGVATILFFINRYENTNRDKLSTAIHVMEGEVRNSLADLQAFDDVIKIYDDAYRDKLEKTIARIAEIHAADINLYDLKGDLKVSSRPLPYSKGIVSMKMDPGAYYHLSHLKEIQYFKEEKIGTLSYLSNYIPVIDENGREYAYLNIPYFMSQTRLNQEISNFLVAIINLNAFIFLIAGIVALFITNRITRSFSFIGDKMKQVNLGKMNEAIAWNRNDEIGELVKEYNKMVGKLDESAAALAKSEREGAWREMARQVAHEIKNPLTPMKLSLQYLQKAISSNSDNVRELSISVAQTLVEQIDHLSQISGEFSQFANIGNPKNELFDLNDAIKPVIQLYSMESSISISWTPFEKPVFINADRTHINRLFTNLIQNAIQAVPEGIKAIITIESYLQDDNALIKLTDNGTGIPEEMKSKIFTPNFTTKTSGTGLGLAMCKGIVEQAKGNIWFETSTGNGTSFFVELPVAEH
ncbi:MAG: ATP-binding protein, partial [Ferruginibacter sp.]